jgi:hypothetical protein
MKVTKRQLKRIIKEYATAEDKPAANGDHHWPRVEWSNVETLADAWEKQELDSFDKGDPSMMGTAETESEARRIWADQVENAAMDLEAELTRRVRQLALSTMKEFTDQLIDGEYT